MRLAFGKLHRHTSRYLLHSFPRLENYNSNLTMTRVISTINRGTVYLDPLTADAKTLQAYLQEGRGTSLNLVDIYLGMIEKHDHYLHAMISVVPRQKLKVIAEALDVERKEGKLRSPLHGIPIIIKVIFAHSNPTVPKLMTNAARIISLLIRTLG